MKTFTSFYWEATIIFVLLPLPIFAQIFELWQGLCCAISRGTAIADQRALSSSIETLFILLIFERSSSIVRVIATSALMRTIEFKLALNLQQQAKVDNWLNVQRWVWNRGLHLLEEFDNFASWDKASKNWVASCPLQWEYYKDDDGILVPFTRLAQIKPYRMSCPIPQTYRQPEIESPTFFGMQYYFAQKNHEDKPWFCEVPPRFFQHNHNTLWARC